MFQRLVLEDSAAIYTVAAFSVATSIFVTVAWRALRMRRSQVDHLAQLPFETETPASQHECRSESSSH
jgi:hypothetical protein